LALKAHLVLKVNKAQPALKALLARTVHKALKAQLAPLVKMASLTPKP